MNLADLLDRIADEREGLLAQPWTREASRRLDHIDWIEDRVWAALEARAKEASHGID